MERPGLSWGWLGGLGSEEALDPVFLPKGQQGFEPEYKRFSPFGQLGAQWSEDDANCLPIVDAFRTLVSCPPPGITAVFQQIQTLMAP